MKLLIQRVISASVEIEQQTVAEIEQGLLVLVGFGHDDYTEKLSKAVDKLVNLRIFADQRGRFQYSVLEQHKSILAVPQFTLYGSTDSGRRPDFIDAMPPLEAEQMFNQFCDQLRQKQLNSVDFGVFGADMKVSLVNDGPVTLMIEL